jgi:hypothetical protein
VTGSGDRGREVREVGTMIDEEAARSLVAFLADVGDAPEVIWIAALAMMERALEEGREARHGRFRVYARGQLRRLRRDVAQAMLLARLAVEMQEASEQQDREVMEDLRAAREEEGRARRRAQTLPAELARLARQRARKAGDPPAGNFHLRPDYPAHGSG